MRTHTSLPLVCCLREVWWYCLLLLFLWLHGSHFFNASIIPIAPETSTTPTVSLSAHFPSSYVFRSSMNVCTWWALLNPALERTVGQHKCRRAERRGSLPGTLAVLHWRDLTFRSPTSFSLSWASPLGSSLTRPNRLRMRFKRWASLTEVSSEVEWRSCTMQFSSSGMWSGGLLWCLHSNN